MILDPFNTCSARSSAEDQEVLFEQILKGKLDFPAPYWDNVSDTAKVCDSFPLLRVTDCCRGELAVHGDHVCPQALISGMLQVEADDRYTAVQVLDHPWVNVS